MILFIYIYIWYIKLLLLYGIYIPYWGILQIQSLFAMGHDDDDDDGNGNGNGGNNCLIANWNGLSSNSQESNFHNLVL